MRVMFNALSHFFVPAHDYCHLGRAPDYVSYYSSLCMRVLFDSVLQLTFQ